MIFNVRMLRFHGADTIRPVDVPDQEAKRKLNEESLLDLIYYYGQNEFCQGENADIIRRSICSVSVGDVIELPNGHHYRVAWQGFERLASA